MKKLYVSLFVVVASFVVTSQSRADRAGGGGDACERKIKVIRDDIKTWIRDDGPQFLKFPAGVTQSQYAQLMTGQMTLAKIKCVAPGDDGYPVVVGKTPKTCRWDKTANESKITCDIQKFNSTDASEQYKLVHHEYASLAGLEVPNADDSHYEVSNQISGFLTQELVTRLAVKKPVRAGDAYVVYEKGSNGDLNKVIYLIQKDLVGWEVVRSWNNYTFLNFSGAPYGDPGTRMCFVQSKSNGLSPHQSYLGIAYKDEDAKKALVAIVVDDHHIVPTKIICMGRDEFFMKYPSKMDEFFNLIDGAPASVTQAKTLSQNKDLKNFLGCYKTLKHNGADVVAADFQSLISVESESVSYGTVDGENIPTILVRAAVKEQYGSIYRSSEILGVISGTVIKANGSTVEVNTNATVLETLNGKPQTGVPVKVSQRLILADQGAGIVTATFDNKYGEENFQLKRETCK